MGTPATTDRGRRTRQRILDAAAEVVAEKGAAAASLDDVGARATTSRSQLYHYFDDKADLLRAVAETTNKVALAAEQDLLAGIDSWAGLVRWAEAHLIIGAERGWVGGCPMANLLAQLGEHDHQVRSVIASGFDRWETHIRVGIQAMIASGELRSDADPDLLAASALASVQGGILLSQAHRDQRPLRHALDGMLALIATYRADHDG